MRYCIVNQRTGLSVRFLECSPDALRLNVPDGCLALETKADVGNYALIGGALQAIGDAPTEHHAYDVAKRAWIDQRAPAQQTALAWRAVREQRDNLLSATDWRVVRALESGAPLSAAWRAYRQALREVTQQPNPEQIKWPTAPQ
jgi:hypothetical protein